MERKPNVFFLFKYSQNIPPSRILHLANSSADDIVASSVLKISKTSETRFRPSWTYKSTTETDWNLIQESKKVRELTPNSRAVRRRERQVKYSSIEKGCILAISQNELALVASGIEGIAHDGRRSKRSRRALKLFLLIFLAMCMSLLLHHISGEEDAIISSTESHEAETFTKDKVFDKLYAITDAIESVYNITTVTVDDIPHKTLNEFEHVAASFKGTVIGAVSDVKNYIKKDPDLFVVVI